MLYKHKSIMDFIELLIFLIFQNRTNSIRNNEIILLLKEIIYKMLSVKLLIIEKFY